MFPTYQDNGYLPAREREIISNKFENQEKGKFFDNIEPYLGDLYIHLKDEYFIKKYIFKKNNIIKQKKIVNLFLEEIILTHLTQK